ncbi:hypothetical protein HMN09_00189500 [Mycena chlorophos]|uniref:Uncharacterized protein n=1 Tax=Mycena chlorophos TaxID=658473 RepID=A0A8H6TNH2_MYCCL|nr:hypothetical protein HMN09_00189500 [Mycena chlorophos]
MSHANLMSHAGPLVAISPPEFLDVGWESLFDGLPSVPSSCSHHSENETTVRGYGASVKLDHDKYQQRVATLRFAKYMLPVYRPTDSRGTKYIEPVLALYHQAVAPEDTKLAFTEEYIGSNFACAISRESGSPSEKELWCLIIFVSSDSVCWDGFNLCGSHIQCASALSSLHSWEQLFLAKQPRFILFTDERRACLVTKAQVSSKHTFKVARVSQFSLTTGSTSLRHIVNKVLHELPVPKREGFPWRTPPGLPLAFPLRPRGFGDFDRYTLERSLPDLEAFLAWKETAANSWSALAIGVGSRFRVDVDAFKKDEWVWRCTDDLPNHPIPQETRSWVARNPRPRSQEIDQLLRDYKELEFEITTVVRSRRDLYSQVFFGTLRAPDGRVSHPVCLKLFVDVLFPIDRPVLMSFFERWKPSTRLNPVNFPADMLQREESAYHRLGEHQGTMLPHCYGFHRFNVGESFSAYGGLFEIIRGPLVSDLDLSGWNLQQQTTFAHHLRHCLRALLYAGVDQGDFRGSQFFLPDGPDYQAGHSMVLIDFAFAVQRLGDEQHHRVAAILLESGITKLKGLLSVWGLSEEAVGSQFDWNARDLYEW